MSPRKPPPNKDNPQMSLPALQLDNSLTKVKYYYMEVVEVESNSVIFTTKPLKAHYPHSKQQLQAQVDAFLIGYRKVLKDFDLKEGSPLATRTQIAWE